MDIGVQWIMRLYDLNICLDYIQIEKLWKHIRCLSEMKELAELVKSYRFIVSLLVFMAD